MTRRRRRSRDGLRQTIEWFREGRTRRGHRATRRRGGRRRRSSVASSVTSLMTPQLALKVDVDTYVGLRDGVPALARALDARGAPRQLLRRRAGPITPGAPSAALLQAGLPRQDAAHQRARHVRLAHAAVRHAAAGPADRALVPGAPARARRRRARGRRARLRPRATGTIGWRRSSPTRSPPSCSAGSTVFAELIGRAGARLRRAGLAVHGAQPGGDRRRRPALSQLHARRARRIGRWPAGSVSRRRRSRRRGRRSTRPTASSAPTRRR